MRDNAFVSPVSIAAGAESIFSAVAYSLAPNKPAAESHASSVDVSVAPSRGVSSSRAAADNHSNLSVTLTRVRSSNLLRASSDITSQSVHLWEREALKSSFYASAFFERDVRWSICTTCGGLDILHTLSCEQHSRDGRCLFCCGCYDVARSGVSNSSNSAAVADASDDYDRYIDHIDVDRLPSRLPSDGTLDSHSDAEPCGELDTSVAEAPPGDESAADFARRFDSGTLPADSARSDADPGGVLGTSVAEAPPGDESPADSARRFETLPAVVRIHADITAEYAARLLHEPDALFKFTHTSLPTFVLAGLCVRVGDALVAFEELPLPTFCSDNLNATRRDWTGLSVTLDQHRFVTIQYFSVLVNGETLQVPVCNCNRYVADNLKRLMRFDARVDVPEGSTLRQAYLLHLRRLVLQQQGGLSPDIGICLHIFGVETAMFSRERLIRAPQFTRSLVVEPDGEMKQRVEVAFLTRCKAYCVAVIGGPGEVAIIRRQTYKFSCSSNECKYHRLRCVHLRAIARCIDAGRGANAAFVLGTLQDDATLLSQADKEQQIGSNRTPEKSFQRLESFTRGPLPLSLREADPTFRDAAYHRQGWATRLSPEPPSQCPGCGSVLLAPNLLSSLARPHLSAACDDARHDAAPSSVSSTEGCAGSLGVGCALPIQRCVLS